MVSASAPLAGNAMRSDAPPATSPAPPGVAPQPSSTVPEAPPPASQDPTYVTEVNRNGQVATTDNPSPATQKQIVPVATAVQDYTAAKSAADQADEGLKEQLADVGAAMTDQQRQAYIQAYRQQPENAAIYQREADAAARLRAAISDPRADEVAAGDADCAAQIADAVELLSTSSLGGAALDWMDAHFGVDGPQGAAANPASAPYRDAFTAERVDRIAESAAQGKAVEASQSGDPTDATQALARQLQRLVNAGIGTSATKAAADLFRGVNDGMYAHDGSRFKASFARAYEQGAGARFESAAYLLAGALVVGGLVSIGDASFDEQAVYMGDLALACQGVVERSGKGLINAGELLKDGQGAFWSEASRLLGKASFLPADGNAANGGRFLVRNAPILGGLASAFYTIGDAVGYFDDPSTAKLGTLVGDVMSLALFFPGGQALGMIGIGVAAICALISSFADDSAADKRHQAETLLLQQSVPGLTPEGAARIVADPAIAAMYADRLGLSPEQIQQQAMQHPGLFNDRGVSESFVRVCEAMGMKGEAAAAFADALLANGDVDLLELAHDVSMLGSENPSPYRLIGFLDDDPDLAARLQPVMQRYYPDFDASVQRGNAEIAYDFPGVGGSAAPHRMEVLAKTDSAEYRAWFVAYAAQNGGLDGMIQAAKNGTDAQRALLAQAIGDACRAGVFDAAEGRALRSELGVDGDIFPSGPVSGQSKPV